MRAITILPSLARTRCGWPLLIVLATLPRQAQASDAVRQLTLQASVESESSLSVSSHVLVFHVINDGGSATAGVDYKASARTRHQGEVILTVDVSEISGPGGFAASDGLLSVGDDGAPIPPHETVIVARWAGGGTRAGRVAFTLRGAAAGRHVVPVRFALTVP